MALVSVIMSVYNGEKYLRESIESLLSQTMSDFEFVITDDCSTDNSLNIILEYQTKDSRIRLIKNEENIGLTKSLNKMLNVVDSKYIARMDADDISLPERLEKQVKYMEENLEIGVCAVKGNTINSRRISKYRHKTHEDIKAALLFYNVVPHASSMFRGEVIYQHHVRYNEDFRIIQDYELWCRLIDMTKFSIIDELLFQSRSADESVTAISSKKEGYREEYIKNIFEKNLEKIALDFDENELNTHYMIGSHKIINNLDDYFSAVNWLLKILKWNEINKHYDNDYLKKIVDTFWYRITTRSTSLGLVVFKSYISSGVFSFNNTEKLTLVRLFLKCLIKYKADPNNRYS